jgi:peptide/nickel transport system permease protein
MWSYVARRLLYSIPVYLGIILIMMGALRLRDPVSAYLGKNATAETALLKKASMGLDRPFLPIGIEDPAEPFGVEPLLEVGRIGLYPPLKTQYVEFLWRIVRLDFGTAERPYRSWQFESDNVGAKLADAVWPTLKITIPALILTAGIAILVGLLSAAYRGSILDRTLMVLVVLGMSISVVVFIVLGQVFGSSWLNQQLGFELFSSNGYEPGIQNWVKYCALPVIIGVVVGMGYDARFYRAVMVEETSRDYITTAVAKGASRPKIIFVHMLKNAMIPVITRIMITIPFLITGSIVMEYQFRIPGMGKLLIDAIVNKDFPIIQTFTAVLAGLFILTNILTDVLYALVDPRVRLA